MGAPQPFASMLLSAAQRYVLTAGDFAVGAPYEASIENIQYISAVTVIYKHSSGGPHYLSLLPDIAGGTPVIDPLDELEVSPVNQAAPTAGLTQRRFQWLPPLAADRVDIAFATNTWEGAARAFFKPSSDILVVVMAFPSRFT